MGKSFRVKVLASAVTFALSAGGAGLVVAAESVDAGQEASQSTLSNVWLIEFDEPGLLYYTAGGDATQATAPAVRGQRKFDARSPAAIAYGNELTAKQNEHLARMQSRLGRNDLDVVFRYSVTHSGMAVRLSDEEAAALDGLPGIAKIEREQIYYPDTYRGPYFIGAPAVWNGDSTPTGLGTKGQGVVVGVFDTGANQTHPSFAPMGAACGYDYPKPKLTARDCLVSGCEGGNPEDADSHGSHTASTTAGNRVTIADTPAPTRDITGVAPCATLITYKVCSSGCPGGAITNAINRAIIDGIDVANFSLGPNVNGQLNPWTESTDRRALDLFNADVFVSMSAGNTRSSPVINPPAEVKHVGPWNITVANSAHDGLPNAPGAMQITGPGSVPPALATFEIRPADTTPVAAQTGLTIRHDPTNAAGCSPFPAGYFNGVAALIQRGGTPSSCAYSEKVANAVAAGAHTVLIYNNAAGNITSMLTNAPDGVQVASMNQAAGEALAAFVTANGATPTLAAVNPAPTSLANVLNSGSLRGPNMCCDSTGSMDVTKPDITAPGTQIYAAGAAPGNYATISGTSMSSPHVAGAGILVRAAQPHWTPAEVISALMMTANTGQLMPDRVTPATADEIGSGMVNLRKAPLAGLVLNETYANFLAANPNSGGVPRNLNIANLRRTSCVGSCNWTRTFRNTLSEPTTWTVTAANLPAGLSLSFSPSTFSFDGTDVPNPDGFFTGDFEEPAGLPETQAVVITATPTAALANIVYADVVLTEQNGLSPPLRLTVAVKGNP
ncbi:MAG: hypothetical protein DI564_16160 [Rhodanobacter denitrificans]|uniref:Peptidase S8/S53 domain-containing protein n=1 Tax=Rhodanobacter denitrificans TaxID=666685 RepID=A0A2W5M9S4_9GAMM|nr:MAG: hypothetical protein DI564_16160 [Rhodanobacter denitrificans]